jgi:molybdenum cofactor biosynthesis enzyme MoaA
MLKQHNETKIDCPLYKKGLYIEKVDKQSALVAMCCDQVFSNNAYDVVDFYNNDYLNYVRNSIETVPECNRCLIHEKHNTQSYRIGQQKVFEQNKITIDDTVELISLSYNCENVCNLKCVTCGPRYSSLWKPDYKKLGYPITGGEVKVSGNGNLIYKSLPLNKIQLLHFQGGEPLLTDDHVNVLKEMEHQGCDLSKVTVSYNTNGTVFPTDEAVELWQKTKLVKIYFSIDAIGNQFEYIRYPAKWSQVQENMFNIRNLNSVIPNMWLQLGVTVSKVNMFYIKDIIDWKNTHFSELPNTDPIEIYITFAGDQSYGGNVLSLESIDQELKQPAIDHLQTISDDYAYIKNSIISKLETARITSGDDWRDYLTKIDSLRNINWKTTLSKLSEHVNG